MNDNLLMTVGELAKKMNISVRTLQYYDRIGLLKPSSMSEGGRRLYSSHDFVLLHQILSMKYLGFSLEDIKHRLLPLNSALEVDFLLGKQEDSVIAQIEKLNEALNIIRTLRNEIKAMNYVDWKKYADIITLLSLKNENFWVIKYFDEETLNVLTTKYAESETVDFMQKWRDLCQTAIELQEAGEDPSSEKGQKLAEEWWNMVLASTGGNAEVLQNLISFHEQIDNWPEDWRELQLKADKFLPLAFNEYLKRNNINLPFGEEEKDE